VVQTYVDRERMFSFYGSLNPEIQTFIEDELHQDGRHLLLVGTQVRPLRPSGSIWRSISRMMQLGNVDVGFCPLDRAVGRWSESGVFLSAI
jgi:hypothetical protein